MNEEVKTRQRLEAILADKLLWFNPYRATDGALTDCAERGRWSPFPAITQMLVFHFHDIREVPGHGDVAGYSGLFFHIGDSEKEHHFGTVSLTYPMTHPATRRPEWTLINGAHLVNSNIGRLAGKSAFVSHAILCDRRRGGPRQAYRMHSLRGSVADRAAVIRRSMLEAKLAMLEELLAHADHPYYLGADCHTFDYSTPLRRALAAIRRMPSATAPTSFTFM